MRKKELVEAIVTRTGVKRRDARVIIEAMLAELGATLAEGRDLILPPLGRVRINRTKELEDGRVLAMKLRQKEQPVQSGPTTSTKTAAE